MVVLKGLAIESNDSLMSGDNTRRVSREEPLKKYMDWVITNNGELPKEFCEKCASVVKPIPHNPKIKLKIKKYAISYTVDGSIIVSSELKMILLDINSGLVFKPLDRAKTFYHLDRGSIPILKVNKSKSGIRESNFCDKCNKYSEVLFGLNKDDSCMPIVFDSEITEGFFTTDLELGTAFLKSSYLYIDEENFKKISSYCFEMNLQ